MFDPDKNGVVTVSGKLAGGHEPLLVGFDDGTFGWPAPYKIANSWGAGWGADGYFFVSAATLTKLLANEGDATIPHALVTAPPPPPPPPVSKTILSVSVSFSDGTSTKLP